MALKLNSNMVGGNGKHLAPGKYLIKIEKVLEKPSKRGGGGSNLTIAEFDLVRVFHTETGVKDFKGTVLGAVVGDRYSHTINHAYGDMAIGKCTALTAACIGVDPQDPAALKAA